MTNPSNAPTDNSTGSSPAVGQQLTDEQIADQGKQLAYAVAAESDDPAAVDQEMSKALDSAGADNFGAVAGAAVVTLSTEIIAGLLAKADRGGLGRLRSDLLVAAAAAAPDSSSSNSNGSAA